MNKEQFAKCPFCGKSETLTIGKASDAFSEPDDCGDPMPYMHTESYAVTCDASKPDGPGGCGASGGYFPSEDEAIAAWNRRAEVERLAAQAEPAPAPVGEYPALPEPSSTAYIQGHSGGEYRTLSDSYEPDCAMFSPQQMHAYLDADRASSCAAQAAPFAKDSWQHAVDNQLVAFGRTSQEFANPHEALAWLAIVNMELGQSNVGAAQAVRLLTSKDIDDVRKTLWRDAQMNLSDLHAEDAAKAFQCKFCEVNGLTVKDQS